MGIPGLNSWFKKHFSDAFVDLSTVKIDHLYVDMNAVLHLVLRRGKSLHRTPFNDVWRSLARNMHQFYLQLYQKLDFILDCCRPQKSVLFSMDGPAPFAKLVTQRGRRKRITLTPSDERGKTVSSLALTPGTPFMQDVHEAISYFICQRLISQKWKHLRMELSGSTVQANLPSS